MARTALKLSSRTQYPIKSCGGVEFERGVEPIRTLAKYHRQPGGVGGVVVFGVYFRPLGPGVLHLGDEVSVLETQDRFVPNDRAAVVDEGALPAPPSDL